jgi:heptosyltransferase II
MALLAPHARILIALPCCIGDVVMGTAALGALRAAYPQAHIDWAVGTWSRAVLHNHPHLNGVIDTGPAALPVKSVAGFARFVASVRAGRYDACVSFVRSPLMSAALWLTGIPVRAGLDSGGRGFGYTIRAPIDPNHPRAEADIYLDVIRAMGVPRNLTDSARTFVPVDVSQRPPSVTAPRYLVLHAGGGSNPGMVLHSKRWPPAQFAALGAALAQEYAAALVLIGGPDDAPLLTAVQAALPRGVQAQALPPLTFAQVAALASGALLYVGNDTGMTHLAAATGAPTLMILGPSDPARYAPYAERALALWKPAPVAPQGVAAQEHAAAWDWARDGITAAEALPRVRAWLAQLGG